MFGAVAVVNVEPFAQRIEVVFGAGKLFPRYFQRIDHPVPLIFRAAELFQLKINELDIERSIVRHQNAVLADKLDKRRCHFGKHRIIFQKFFRQPVHGNHFFRHAAFRVDILMISAPRRDMVNQLDRADFHQTVAVFGRQTGCFRIKHNLAQNRLHFSLSPVRSKA